MLFTHYWFKSIKDQSSVVVSRMKVLKWQYKVQKALGKHYLYFNIMTMGWDCLEDSSKGKVAS